MGFNKVFGLKITSLLISVSVLFLFTTKAYSHPLQKKTLRVPSFSQEDANKRKAETLENLMWGSKDPKDHRLIAYRNNMPGEKQGQVTMRVCEISELTDREREILAERFGEWLTDFKAGTPSIVHPDEIRDIISALQERHLSRNKNNRIYIAFSDGGDNIDAEGYLITDYHERNRRVAFLEINPHNRDLDVENWRNEMWLEEKTLQEMPEKPKSKSRYLGVGRQLLWYAVKRELKDFKQNGLIFRLNAPAELAEERLERVTRYHRKRLEELKSQSWMKILGYLKDAPETDMESVEILQQIEMTQDSNLASYI